jgi:hypothetical protein
VDGPDLTARFRLGLVAGLTFLLMGCEASTVATAAPTPKATAAPAATGTPASDPTPYPADYPSATPTPTSVRLIGVGATVADWTLQKRQAAKVVAQIGGRVTWYEEVLPKGTGEAAAIAQAKSELPTDATVLWTGRGPEGGCFLAEFKSPTIASVVQSPDDADGRVLITFDTEGSLGYDPNNANDVFFDFAAFASSVDVPAC